MARLFFALAMGSALTCAPMPASADGVPSPGHPYRIDDLLKMEAFGQVSLDPSGSRLVFEREKAFDTAPVFDHDYYNTVGRSDLYVADVAHPGPARRLLATGEGSGQVLGAWSPSGRRLLIYRLRDRVWTVGVVEVTTGAVQWLGLSPELPGWGRSVQWLSDDRLLLVVRTDGKSPWRMRATWEPLERVETAWAQAGAGDTPVRTMIGSGAFRDRTPVDAADALVEVDLAGNVRRELMRGQIYDIEASPDGRQVAVARFSEDLPVEPDQPFLQGEFPKRRTLAIVDVATAATWAPLGDDDLLPNLLSWSASSKSLLVWTRSGGGWESGRLLRVTPGGRTTDAPDLAGLKPAITETGLRTPVITAGWVGSRPVLYARPQGGRADWYALDHGQRTALTSRFQTAPERLGLADGASMITVADGGLWRISGRGLVERVSSSPERVIEQRPGLVDLGQRFFYNAAVPPPALAVEQAGRLWSVAPGGRRIAVATPPSDARVVATGDKGAAWIEIDDHYRQSLMLGTPDGAVRVARINDHYADIAFARRLEVKHTGPSGEALTSWLYLPAVVSGAPPPLIVFPYPGPASPAPDPIAEPTYVNTAINVPVLTGAGYAVLVPSLPRDAFPNEPSRDLAKQVLAVVDAAAPLCECNTERLVLWGHSFGGHAVMAIASQTNRFSAVVAQNGLYDLISGWGSFSPLARRVSPENGLSIRSQAGWVETGQGSMGGPPWRELDRYVRNSPLFQIEAVTAPVLLINSDLDYVSPGQAEEVFSALYRLNKDSVLLTYYGEGHIFSSPANIRDMMNTSLDWIHEVLASDPLADARPKAVEASAQGRPPPAQSQLRSQDSIKASSNRSP